MDIVRSKSALGISGRPPSTLTAQRSVSRVCRRISSPVAWPVQMPSPREMNSHDGLTDGRGQFWASPVCPANRACATLPSGARSSPENVPDAVQYRSEFQPWPCVSNDPLKTRPSCTVTVNEPEQPPQVSLFPFSRLWNSTLPDARHRPVNEGKFCAGTGVVTEDGDVGVSAVTLPHAVVSTIAGITARSPRSICTTPSRAASSVPPARPGSSVDTDS